LNLSIFAHLGSRIIDLDRRRQVKVKRLSRGDLPDWIVCASDLSSLTVAEAKGCHDVANASLHAPCSSMDCLMNVRCVIKMTHHIVGRKCERTSPAEN
jgi:hypothetical protein